MLKKDLKNMPPSEIIWRLRDGESVLLTAGLFAEFLKARFLSFFLKIAFHLIIGNLICENQSARRDSIRRYIKKTLDRIAPWDCNGKFTSGLHSTPIVVGFNHSTSGDMFRVLAFVIDKCQDKSIVLPVSLVVYEAFAPLVRVLEDGGINLCPIISYGYYNKVKNDKNRFILRKVRVNLETHYHVMINECVKRNGAALVPLGFDKRPTIFKTSTEAKGRDIQSLSLDMTKIVRYLKKHQRVHYVAMAVRPRTRTSASKSSGINFFRSYLIEYSWFSPEEINKLRNDEDRYKLEYAFLKAIANKLPFDRWHPKEKE